MSGHRSPIMLISVSWTTPAPRIGLADPISYLHSFTLKKYDIIETFVQLSMEFLNSSSEGHFTKALK